MRKEVDIKGSKIDSGINIQKPKIDIPGICVYIRSIDGNIETNINANLPQVNLRGPKSKPKFDAGVDIHDLK